MPYIPPGQYAATPACELLQAAAAGFIGFDRRLIHALVDEPARTLPAIVRFALEGKHDPALAYDFIAIFHYLNAPEAVPFYIKSIRDNAGDVPDEITEAVIALSAPMLEPLLDLYRELGEEEGGEIGFLLAALGVRDPRILDLLRERLEYDAADGALSLGLYGDPAAIPHIQRILDEIPEEDNELRNEIRRAISEIEEAQSSPRVAAPPFDIFELYPDEAGPDFDILPERDRLALLNGVPAEIRAGAAASFGNEELPRPTRDRLFDVARTDPDANVRGRAWEALSQHAADPDIHAALIDAARNAPIDERTGAIVALASNPEPDEESMPLIEALYGEPAARAKTLEAMWKSLDGRFAHYMVDHFDDPDPRVRHHAIYGVGYLNVGSEAPRLIELFKNEDFRHDALLAYALSAPLQVTRGRMKPFLRRIEQLSGGLSLAESEVVREALDQRLLLHGLKPVFGAESAEKESEPGAAASAPKPGRNDPCPCGSGKKYKKCHGA